ncbi:MAG: peptidoglycan recognition protein family protein [Planctomycetota bacterium]|jgi:hypothetical protein
MSVQSREAKVFAVLLASMTAGAILLMALGNNPPSAGAFCLNTYYQLDTVEKVISSRVAQSPGRWNGVEVYYSGTEAGNIEQLASLSGLAGPEDLNCHFIICNGLGGGDGQIQSTEKWQRQWPVVPARTHGRGQTIRICLIANGKTASPTDFQIKRVEALIEGLYRTFDIQPQFILYPDDWR